MSRRLKLFGSLHVASVGERADPRDGQRISRLLAVREGVHKPEQIGDGLVKGVGRDAGMIDSPGIQVGVGGDGGKRASARELAGASGASGNSRAKVR